jgi:sodium-dependent dicarboxylate transporter 2/3/5
LYLSTEVVALLILCVVVVLYVTEVIPLAVTTVLGCSALVWFQCCKATVAFSGFTNYVTWLVIGMVMVGGALFETGAADVIGRAIVRITGPSEKGLVLGMFPVVMLMSAFLNNSSTTATFLPIVQGVSASSGGKVRLKMLAMPLAFAATTGGMCTLVGSTPPLLVNGALENLGYAPFGFFEFAIIGVPICVLVLIYSLTVCPLMGERMWGKQIAEEQAALAREGTANVVVEQVAADAKQKGKMWTSGAILLLCVLGFTLQPSFSDYIDLGTIAITGAMLTVVTRCIPTVKRLWELTDWNTFFVLGGAIGFAKGLEVSGAGQLVADTVLAWMGDASPFIIWAVFCLVAVILTQMMSNTAACAMMAPMGMFVAQGLGVDPLPWMMGLATATAAAYMTPVGTPPNTIVLMPGKYSFMDYVKLGGLFQLLSFIAVCIIVPIVWPF